MKRKEIVCSIAPRFLMRMNEQIVSEKKAFLKPKIKLILITIRFLYLVMQVGILKL
jgi:hypothetical protein